MKLPVVLAVLIGTLVLACSTAPAPAAGPTPNIAATVEVLVNQELSKRTNTEQNPGITPEQEPTIAPTNTPAAGPSTPTKVLPTATRVPPTATPVPVPIAHLWVGELLDQVVANEITAGLNYTGKLISVTGHIAHLGGAVWPRSGYEIEIEDVGDYRTKNSGSLYCYPQSSQSPLLTEFVTGDRITVQGIVEELEALFLATVRLDSCSIDDVTFNPQPISPSCVSLQESWEDSYGYLTLDFKAQNGCDVAVWFTLAGSALFVNNQQWAFTVTEYAGDYFVLGPGDSLDESDMIEKPNWADGRPGEITTVDIDVSFASATGLP